MEAPDNGLLSFFNQRGGIGSFGYIQIGLPVFLPKNSVFQFCCSFYLADFTRLSIWFSVSVKNTNGFLEFFSVFLRSER